MTIRLLSEPKAVASGSSFSITLQDHEDHEDHEDRGASPFLCHCRLFSFLLVHVSNTGRRSRTGGFADGTDHLAICCAGGASCLAKYGTRRFPDRYRQRWNDHGDQPRSTDVVGSNQWVQSFGRKGQETERCWTIHFRL